MGKTLFLTWTIAAGVLEEGLNSLLAQAWTIHRVLLLEDEYGPYGLYEVSGSRPMSMTGGHWDALAGRTVRTIYDWERMKSA